MARVRKSMENRRRKISQEMLTISVINEVLMASMGVEGYDNNKLILAVKID